MAGSAYFRIHDITDCLARHHTGVSIAWRAAFAARTVAIAFV